MTEKTRTEQIGDALAEQTGYGTWRDYIHIVQRAECEAALLADDMERRGRVSALIAALLKCRDQFRWYTELHEAKGPEHADKAARNREFAEMCEAALNGDKP